MDSRPLPAISDFGHDGWVCTFLYTNSWNAISSRAEQLLSGQTAWTFHNSTKITPSGPHSYTKLGKTPCRTSSP
jgi:hypothetical protein